MKNLIGEKVQYPSDFVGMAGMRHGNPFPTCMTNEFESFGALFLGVADHASCSDKVEAVASKVPREILQGIAITKAVFKRNHGTVVKTCKNADMGWPLHFFIKPRPQGMNFFPRASAGPVTDKIEHMNAAIEAPCCVEKVSSARLKGGVFSEALQMNRLDSPYPSGCDPVPNLPIGGMNPILKHHSQLALCSNGGLNHLSRLCEIACHRLFTDDMETGMECFKSEGEMRVSEGSDIEGIQ